MTVHHHPPIGRILLGLVLAPLATLLAGFLWVQWENASHSSSHLAFGPFAPSAQFVMGLYAIELIVGMPMYLMARLLRMNNVIWYIVVPPVLCTTIGGILKWNIITLWIGGIAGLALIPATVAFWLIVRPDRYRRTVVVADPEPAAT
jgi:hypothetical protein